MAKAKAPALFEDGEIASAPDGLVQGAVDAYNEVAARAKWRKATVLTEARRKTLKRAVQDYGGIINFRQAMERAGKSPFLLGQVGRTDKHSHWKPDLDFFCQPKSIVSLLEGKYDPEPEAPKRVHIPTVGFKPPHLRNMPAFVPEPPEVRLEAMIASYRKHGNYKRANEIETQLAELQNRPPVHVPAPDVAWVTSPPAGAPARDYSTNTQVSDVVDEYDMIPEDAWGDGE